MRISQTITRAARLDPDKPAVLFEDRVRTFKQLADRVARLAGSLADLGVRPSEADHHVGTRVAYLGLNSDRYLEYFLAVPWAGGAFVPVNTRLAPPEMVHWLNDSEASILLIDDTHIPVLEELLDGCPHIAHVIHAADGEPPAGLLGYEHLIAEHAPIAPRDRGGDQVAGLFYTGGTTGRSKGVMLSHHNLMVNSLQLMPYFPVRRGGVYLHAAPMFHLADGAAFLAAAFVGSAHAIVDRFTPEAAAEAIDRHNVTVTLLVATMVAMFVDQPALAAHDLSSLEAIVYGGSPMSEAVIARTRATLPGIELVQVYGQTEASPLLSALTSDRHVFDGPLAGKTRSAGVSVAGVELVVMSETGEPLPHNEVGEICARGDNVMRGYWKQPELTAWALRDGWLHTGDLGYVDAEGFVFIVDRLKDMIVSGGENVFSVEVEAALSAHEAVLECAVFGVPDDRWGERVHAAVVLQPDRSEDAEQLMAHCRALIAAYKCPRSMEILAEPLPRSGAGKVVKTALRESHWNGAERRVGGVA